LEHDPEKWMFSEKIMLKQKDCALAIEDPGTSAVIF
jgi:hypothetical protein